MKIKINKESFDHQVRDHVTVRLTSLSWGYDDDNPKDNWFNWDESPEGNTAIIKSLQTDWLMKDGIIESEQVWYDDGVLEGRADGYLYIENGYTSKSTKKCLIYFSDLMPDDVKEICHSCGQEIKKVSDE